MRTEVFSIASIVPARHKAHDARHRGQEIGGDQHGLPIGVCFGGRSGC